MARLSLDPKQRISPKLAAHDSEVREIVEQQGRGHFKGTNRAAGAAFRI
jgi:hypothetical protein